MIGKCYNKTYNKALRDGNLKGLLINNSLSGVIMTTANNTRNIERGQSSKSNLTYGIAYNSKGKHKTKRNRRLTSAYSAWRPMIQRCYDPKEHIVKPLYIDCIVADEWHDFQNFADWFYSHPHNANGYELDKDLLVKGNKLYSPDTCCLVPHELNVLLLDRRSDRGEYPQGVDRKKSELKYRARLNVDGKSIHLGYFNCPNEAHQAYKKAKEAYVKEKALEWQDRIADNVFQALMKWTLDS